MNQVDAPTAVPGSISGKLQLLKAVMTDLAGTDYTGIPVEVQAEVLRAMHQVGAGQAAVFGRAGWAFTCERGYDAYAQKNTGRWHVTQGRVTRAAGYAARAWIRRYERHPLIVAALADGDVLSESWARQLAAWSDKLPEEHQPKADEILVTAARAGVDLEGLAKIAAELAALLTPPDEDNDRGPGRGLRLETTYEGAGVLTGDLTPSCAAMVDAVLGALSQSGGKEDLRTPAERMHDALEEAMRRLLAARLLPQRAGAPVTALVHISLADLLALDPDSVLSRQWVTLVHARWMAERAGASVQPGDNGAWLHGDAAAAAARDATIVPMVTGTVDITILDHLIGTCIAYGRLRDQHPGPDQDTDTHSPDDSAAQHSSRPGQEPAGGAGHGYTGPDAGRETGSGPDGPGLGSTGQGPGTSAAPDTPGPDSGAGLDQDSGGHDPGSGSDTGTGPDGARSGEKPAGQDAGGAGNGPAGPGAGREANSGPDGRGPGTAGQRLATSAPGQDPDPGSDGTAAPDTPGPDTGPDRDTGGHDRGSGSDTGTGPDGARSGEKPAGQDAGGAGNGPAGPGAGREANSGPDGRGPGTAGQGPETSAPGTGQDPDPGSDGTAAPGTPGPDTSAGPDDAAASGQDVPGGQPGRQAGTGPEAGTGPVTGRDPAAAQTDRAAEPDRLQELARLERLIIGDAIALMSGSGGLASFLRRQLLGKGLDGPSLPLDVGDTDRIPPHIRRAVTLRDRHCAFPGGCDRPAWDCEPHHCDPRVQHGPTSLSNLINLCWLC